MKNRTSRLLTAAVYVLISIGSLLLVSGICSMAFSNACAELEEQYLCGQGREIIETIEGSVNFGKNMEHYYGMEELLLEIQKEEYDTVQGVILNPEGEILYSALEKGNAMEETLARLLSEKQKSRIRQLGGKKEWKQMDLGGEKTLVYPIYQGEQKLLGYLMLLYDEEELIPREKLHLAPLLLIWTAAAVLLVVFQMLAPAEKGSIWYLRLFPTVVVMTGLLVYMVFLFGTYQGKYKQMVNEKAGQEAEQVCGSLEQMSGKGFALERVNEISGYLDRKTRELDAVGNINVVHTYYRSPEDGADFELYGFYLPIGGSGLALEVQPSRRYLDKKVRDMALAFAAIFVICLMVTFELGKMKEVIMAKAEGRHTPEQKEPYESISAQIRLISFFSYTAIYLSMPYAAVIMKNGNARVFGFSAEISASLPLMLELFCIMLGSVLIQKIFRRERLHRIGAFVCLFLFLGNFACIYAESPYVLLGLRAFCGLGFAFLKYWLNGIVAAGSKDEEGFGKNCRNLNGGLLGGITAGAALGAIFAQALGYQANYCFTALLLLAVLLIAYLCLPFAFLNEARGREEPAAGRSAGIPGILKEREVRKVLLLGCVPFNVGLMYVVAFLPVYMNHVGQPALAVSYAYLVNGLSGVYAGGLLSSWLRRLTDRAAAAVTMLLAAVGILVLVLGSSIGIILVSSAVMGLFDGYGSPGILRYFTGLRAIKGRDAAGMLTLFHSVGSGVQIICPMLYNMLLQPEGRAVFLAAFGLCYVGIAVLFLIPSGRNAGRRIGNEEKIQ